MVSANLVKVASNNLARYKIFWEDQKKLGISGMVSHDGRQKTKGPEWTGRWELVISGGHPKIAMFRRNTSCLPGYFHGTNSVWDYKDLKRGRIKTMRPL